MLSFRKSWTCAGIQIDLEHLVLWAIMAGLLQWLCYQYIQHHIYYEVLGLIVFPKGFEYVFETMWFATIAVGLPIIQNWQTRDWLNRYLGAGIMVMILGMTISNMFFAIGAFMVGSTHYTLKMKYYRDAN